MGAAISRTSRSIVSRSATNGTNTESAPASRYAFPRRTASANPPPCGLKASVRAFRTIPTPAASAAARAARTRSTASGKSRSAPPSSSRESSRFIPTAPAAMTPRTVSATACGARP